jgi:hypothetical protein
MSKLVLLPKYSRREDLTGPLRLKIACIVTYFAVYGTITGLSRKYKVSRQFLYDLKKEFAIYGENYSNHPNFFSEKEEKVYVIEQILSLRLECKSSIEGISSHLSRFGTSYSSVGFISQILKKIGEKQGSVLFLGGSVIKVAFCSDEIFKKGEAILITVDAHSMAILSISWSKSRSGESWERHWNALLLAGYTPYLLCNDEGSGMSSAKKTIFPELVRQSDSFHAISHRFGLYVERYEKAALKAISNEYDCMGLVERSKTFPTYEKRYENYEKLCQITKKAIALYDNFVFLYHCLLEQLQVFDNQGYIKDFDKVLLDFDTALALLLTLKKDDIKAHVKHIEGCKEELFRFRKTAQTIVEALKQDVPQDILAILCLIWQTRKNKVNAKQEKRRNALKRKEALLIEQLRHMEQQKEGYEELVFAKLDQLVQSSAAVECINSILRPYLVASKNQITQEALNLFMAYHNHRRFRAGKRKGKTPFELLTGKPQEKDWMQIILEKAA